MPYMRKLLANAQTLVAFLVLAWGTPGLASEWRCIGKVSLKNYDTNAVTGQEFDHRVNDHLNKSESRERVLYPTPQTAQVSWGISVAPSGIPIDEVYLVLRNGDGETLRRVEANLKRARSLTLKYEANYIDAHRNYVIADVTCHR